ncbi:MAG: hypothetical protein ABW168_11560 [Sedimenticola sp.]
MCLIDRVLSYDNRTIRCTSNSHLDKNNPLRRGDRLSSINGIEYAAQVMAVHSSLVENIEPGQIGYLGALRNIEINQPWLDSRQEVLVVEARLIGSSFAGAIYQFSVEADSGTIISGRATIMTGSGKQ